MQHEAVIRIGNKVFPYIKENMCNLKVGDWIIIPFSKNGHRIAEVILKVDNEKIYVKKWNAHRQYWISPLQLGKSRKDECYPYVLKTERQRCLP